MGNKMTLKRVMYPGRFDPITCGHLDMIKRASGLFESCVVAVSESSHSMWPLAKRVEMVKQCVAGLSHVEVCAFSGLLVDFAKAKQVDGLVRGLRNPDDFYDEYRMSQMNRTVSDAGLETVFLFASPDVSTISASLVREIHQHGGCVHPFVPEAIWSDVDEHRGT